MRKALLTSLALIALSLSVYAQPSLCTVYGTIRDGFGNVVPGAKITLVKVVAPGQIVQIKNQTITADANGVISFTTYRSASSAAADIVYVYLLGDYVGFNTRGNPVAFAVPNASTLNLSTAVPAVSTPNTVPFAVGTSLVSLSATGTSGGTTTLDFGTGDIHTVTTPTSGTFTVTASGLRPRIFVVFIVQGAGGSHTLTWDSSVFKFCAAQQPTLSTTAGAKDMFTVLCDGTYCYIISSVLDVR